MPDRWQAHGRRKEIAQIPLSSRDLSGKEDRCPAAGPPRRRISVCSLGCVLLKSHIWQEGVRDWVEVISGRAMSGTGLNPWPDTGMVIARSKLSSVAIFAGGTLILYLSHYAKHSVDHVSVIRSRVRARSKWFLQRGTWVLLYFYRGYW